MKKLMIILLLLLIATSAFARELFVGYLKPVTTKDGKTIFSKRDPTQEPFRMLSIVPGEKGAAADFDLKAILYNPQDKKAYINDNLHREGDNLNGHVIKSIFPEKVILVKGSKETVLKFEEGDKK